MAKEELQKPWLGKLVGPTAQGQGSRLPHAAWTEQLHQLRLSCADPDGFITVSPAGNIPSAALPTCQISPSCNSVLWIKVRELKEKTPQRLEQVPSLGTGEGFPSVNHLTVFYFI